MSSRRTSLPNSQPYSTMNSNMKPMGMRPALRLCETAYPHSAVLSRHNRVPRYFFSYKEKRPENSSINMTLAEDPESNFESKLGMFYYDLGDDMTLACEPIKHATYMALLYADWEPILK